MQACNPKHMDETDIITTREHRRLQCKGCFNQDADVFLPRVPLTTPAIKTGYSTQISRPSTPAYSLCGSRLRWVNTAQLLSFQHSHGPNHALLTTPPRSTTIRSEEEATSRQHCHSYRRPQTAASNISFITVAHFHIGACNRSRAPQASGLLPPDDSSPSLDSLGSCRWSEERRFTTVFTMPVPDTFRSVWSTEHIPALHVSSRPDKLKKLLSDREICRDDNYNIKEVSESEVPVSRLHGGLKNGVNQADEELPLRSVASNVQYTESVSVARIPSRQEYRYGTHCDIDNSRHYREEVRLVPGQTNPGRYYSTLTQCFINSNYRRYRETVFITLTAPSPKQYSTSVFIFPTSCRETFVSSVEHHDEKTIKWYKVGVSMEAKDYVSVKFVQVN